MSSRPRRRAARIVASSAALSAGLAVALLAGSPQAAHANTAGTGLIISEVYGGGGNSGATYTNDFVELYNPTGSEVSVAGWSVQYRSATGTGPGQVTALSGAVPAHGHYLVQEAAGTGGSTALPTPDASGTIAMAGSGGQTWLADTTTALTPPTGNVTGSATGVDHIVDLVGGATTATSFETAHVATAPGNTTSLARVDGAPDTDSNAADFTVVGAPTPQNSTAAPTGGDPGSGSGPTRLSIAQIQGTDTGTSPHAGQTVETQGVVTAVYPTGGFNGFYLETGGAPAEDTTPGASDAVFVFGLDGARQVHLGDSVDVVGKVSEFKGATEITSPTVTALATPLPPVSPDQLTWSDLGTDAQKEAHEGELIAPQGDFTVTDDYNTNFYGEIELAAGPRMLKQPTDVGTPGSDAAREQAAYNASHAVFLDDGSSWSYTATSHSSDPLPWLTPSTPVSDGAAVTFHQPVVLDYRNDQWNLEPRSQVSGDGSAVATFSDTRTAKTRPADVGGQLRLATFNMENFFTTTGQDFVTDVPGATCSYYTDRAGTPVTDRSCAFPDGSPGPRGAATEAAFDKQLAKEIVGINGLGASVVSLEEVENAAKFGQDRDATLAALVAALNAADGAGTWAYVPSPGAADLPPLDQQDVIRTAFIYKPADVTPVGASHVLSDDSGPGQPFSIAREPLAQGFKAAGEPDVDAFLVVANHLKSKGADATGLFDDCPGGDAENPDPADDQGGFNCTRLHQVKDMWAWAQGQARALHTDRVFLVGDFNAYDHEDPIEYLDAQGFTELASRYDAEHSSYSYGGLEGSLDHVLASPAALAMVTGATIWQIDAQESVAFAYSRDNYNITRLYDGTDPFATSDHDPEVVGLDPPRGRVDATVTAADTTVVYSKAAAVVPVAVTAPGATPSGTVQIRDGADVLATGTLGPDGTATIVLPEKSLKRGTHRLSAAYSGDASVNSGTATFTVTVTNPAGR